MLFHTVLWERHPRELSLARVLVIKGWGGWGTHERFYPQHHSSSGCMLKSLGSLEAGHGGMEPPVTPVGAGLVGAFGPCHLPRLHEATEQRSNCPRGCSPLSWGKGRAQPSQGCHPNAPPGLGQRLGQGSGWGLGREPQTALHHQDLEGLMHGKESPSAPAPHQAVMSEGPGLQPGPAGAAVPWGWLRHSPRHVLWSLHASSVNRPVIPSSQSRAREVIDKWRFLRLQVCSQRLALALEWQQGQGEAAGQKADPRERKAGS